MKTVVNSQQVAHLWANRSQRGARNGKSSIYFSDEVIYSYRDSWPLAVFTPWRDADGAHVVVINTQHYGNTTTRHLSHVRDSLRGHNVVTFEATAGMDARALARGEAHALGNVIGVYADRMNGAMEKAAGRRDPDYFAHDIRTARGSHETALRVLRMAAGGRPVSGDRDLSALASSIPALPDYLPGGEQMAKGDDHEAWRAGMPAVMAAYREARRAAYADESVRVQSNACADAWKRAKQAAENGDWDGAAKLLGEIEKLRAKIDRTAKDYRIAIPRSVPSVKACAALRAKVEPRRVEAHALALAAACNLYARMVIRMDGERKHSRRRVFAAGYPDRITRNGSAPDELARVLIEGGYNRVDGRHMVALGRARQVCAAFITGDAEHAQGLDEKSALVISYSGRDAAARAAKSQCRAAYVRTAEVIDTLYPRLHRAASRGHVVGLLHNVRQRIRNAAERNDGREWTIARTAADHYRRGLEKHASVAGGLPSFDSVMAEVYEGERECRKREAVESLRGFDYQPWPEDFAADVRVSLGRGRPFQAAELMRQLDARTAELQAAVVVMSGNADVFRDEPHTRARIIEKLGEMKRHVDNVRAAVEASERDAVTAWRNHDTSAPRPSGYYFRLTSNGGEIESSGGARVSIQAGRRLWAMIRRCVERGEPMTWAYNEGPRVGPFRLQSIGADGSAVVGCHAITAGEARAFAAHMQWPPFGSETTEDDNAEQVEVTA